MRFNNVALNAIIYSYIYLGVSNRWFFTFYMKEAICVYIVQAQNVTPTNDVCINARTLTIGSTTAADSSLATDDEIVGRGECSSTYRRGLWYTFVGTGDRMGFVGRDFTTISTTSIFSGGCETISCVATNRNKSLISHKNVFNIDTTAGTTYHVLIEDSAESLKFGIVPIVVNDICVNAKLIDGGINVDTTFATIDSDMKATNDCILDDKSFYPGLWYTFVGTGRRTGSGGSTCFLGSISIYTGGCSSTTRTCAYTISDPCDLRQRFSFDTNVGETYHVLLQTMFSTRVDISFVDAPIVLNDFCINATSLTADADYIAADIRFATNDPESNDCGTTPVSPGVWYTFLGTGDPMTVNACSDYSLYPSFIRVFSGGCDNNQRKCHAAAISGIQSTCNSVTFDTKRRQKYYILVNSQYSQSISVSVEKVPVCRNICKIQSLFWLIFYLLFSSSSSEA